MQSSVSFRRGIVLSLVLICVSSAARPAYAQQVLAAAVADEVVVTATRFKQPQYDVPVGVTVIGAEQIRATTAATVPELLMQFPGIQVRDNSGSPNQQVDMRGFGITGDQNTLVSLMPRKWLRDWLQLGISALSSD